MSLPSPKREWSWKIDGSVVRAAIVLLPTIPALAAVIGWPHPILTNTFVQGGPAAIVPLAVGWTASAILEWIGLGYWQGLATAPFLIAAVSSVGTTIDLCSETATGGVTVTKVVHYVCFGLWCLSEVAAMVWRRTNLILVAFNITIGVAFVVLYLIATFAYDNCLETGLKVAGVLELVTILSARLFVALTPAFDAPGYERVQW